MHVLLHIWQKGSFIRKQKSANQLFYYVLKTRCSYILYDSMTIICPMARKWIKIVRKITFEFAARTNFCEDYSIR